jgi:hypothetical protein
VFAYSLCAAFATCICLFIELFIACIDFIANDLLSPTKIGFVCFGIW